MAPSSALRVDKSNSYPCRALLGPERSNSHSGTLHWIRESRIPRRLLDYAPVRARSRLNPMSRCPENVIRHPPIPSYNPVASRQPRPCSGPQHSDLTIPFFRSSLTHSVAMKPNKRCATLMAPNGSHSSRGFQPWKRCESPAARAR